MWSEAETYEGPNRRQAQRFATLAAISVREAGRHQVPAMLESLSMNGCSVAGVTVSDRAETVWVRIPGLESQPARLCWARLGVAGLRFERPLHPAVADHLANRPPEAIRPAALRSA